MFTSSLPSFRLSEHGQAKDQVRSVPFAKNVIQTVFVLGPLAREVILPRHERS
jgi:hypothetical protein